jgi:hypothetical protein
MFVKALAAVGAGAIMVSTLSMTGVDAATKKRYLYRSNAPYHYRTPTRYQYGSEPPSLDGRVTGYPRSCGLDRFQRDDQGTPVGPYCH